MEWRRGCRALQGKAVGCSTRSTGVRWLHRAGCPGKEQPRSWSQPGLRGAAAVTRALPGHSSHTPDLHRCCFHQVSGEMRCGRTHSTFCAQPLRAITHWGAGNKTSEANPNPPSLRIYRNWIALSGVGLSGVSTDCASEHSCCSGTSCSCLKTHMGRSKPVTDQDGLIAFPLGLAPARLPPSQHGWVLSSVPREKQHQGETPNLPELMHTEICLEAKLKASFWVTHASPSFLHFHCSS